jgi:ribose transport system substrate-binding protein
MRTSPHLREESTPSGASTLDKGLTVLETVEKANQPVGIQEVARATGIQRMAVSRLLSTLEQRGYVVRDDARKYHAISRRRRVLAAYCAPLTGSGFRTDVAVSLRAAAQRAGVELMVLDNQENDVDAVIANTESVIAAAADVVIFFQPTESLGHIIADRLSGASVPFITVEVPIQGGAYYGANNYQAGKLAGVALGRFAESVWKSRFDRLVLVEPARSSNLQARLTGVLIGLREILGEVDETRVIHLEGKANLEASQAAMAELLRKLRPGARLLVSGFNDLSAVGALRALRAAGRENDAAVVGQNAVREVQMEIRDSNSRMIASVAYFPERYGPNLIRLATDIAAGRRAPPALYTNHLVLDRRNIDRIYPAPRSRA